jgi:hypothetical protein
VVGSLYYSFDYAQNVVIPHSTRQVDQTSWLSKRVSDRCLTPTQQFSDISWQEQVNFQ